MTRDEVEVTILGSINHMKQILRQVLPGEEQDFEFDRGYKEGLEFALSYVKKINEE